MADAVKQRKQETIRPEVQPSHNSMIPALQRPVLHRHRGHAVHRQGAAGGRQPLGVLHYHPQRAAAPWPAGADRASALLLVRLRQAQIDIGRGTELCM